MPHNTIKKPKRHAHRERHWIRCATIALLCVLVSACEESKTALFDEYQSRLSSTLNTEIDEKKSDTAAEAAHGIQKHLAYPSHQALQVELPESRINLLEFLKLSSCSLSEIVGQRNSSLGKVAAASTRLMQTLDFLQHAPACIEQLNDSGNTELADKLRLAYTDKQQALAQSIWQATFAGPEFQRFWQAPNALDDYPANTNSQITQALIRWQNDATRWLSGDYHYERSELEAALFQIQQGDGGALLLASHTLFAGLSDSNALLKAKLDKNPLCFNQRKSPKGERFFAVVRRYFIGDIQVWAADLNRRSYQLMQPTRALETLLDSAQPDAYRRFSAQRDRALARLQSAPKTHVGHIKPLLAQCGLVPQ